MIRNSASRTSRREGFRSSPETLTPDVFRFHASCPMGGSSVPAMLARMDNIITGEFSGIHRTALSDDFSSKRVMSDSRPSRMIMGVARGFCSPALSVL